MNPPRFPIGQRFRPIGRKHSSDWTVVDVLRTYNSAGELVRIRYVATHDLLGQAVTDSDIPETTVARGLIPA